MHLPEILVRMGLTLPMTAPAGIVPRGDSLSNMNSQAGDIDVLTQFHSNLMVARGVVEEQKRDAMMQVSSEGLRNILAKIKVLEDEVNAMLGSKAPVKLSSADNNSAKAKGPEDCGPEKLLVALGGTSVQTRSLDVSEHPLFQRSSDCTLDSVTGKSKAAAAAGSSPVQAASASIVAPEGSAPEKPANTGSPAVMKESKASDAPSSGAAPAESSAQSVADSSANAAQSEKEKDTAAASGSKPASAPAIFKEQGLLTTTVTSTRRKQMTITMTTTRTTFIRITAASAQATQQQNMVDASETAPSASSPEGPMPSGSSAESKNEAAGSTPSAAAPASTVAVTGDAKNNSSSVADSAASSGISSANMAQSTAKAADSNAPLIVGNKMNFKNSTSNEVPTDAKNVVLPEAKDGKESHSEDPATTPVASSANTGKELAPAMDAAAMDSHASGFKTVAKSRSDKSVQSMA